MNRSLTLIFIHPETSFGEGLRDGDGNIASAFPENTQKAKDRVRRAESQKNANAAKAAKKEG